MNKSLDENTSVVIRSRHRYSDPEKVLAKRIKWVGYVNIPIDSEEYSETKAVGCVFYEGNCKIKAWIPENLNPTEIYVYYRDIADDLQNRHFAASERLRSAMRSAIREAKG